MSVCAQWCRVPSSTFRSSSIAVSFRRSGSVVCHAKKKGKKGGKQKKGSLLGSVPKKSAIQPWQTTEVIMQHLLMVESYRCSSVHSLTAIVATQCSKHPSIVFPDSRAHSIP